MPSRNSRRFLSSDKFQVELKQLLGDNTPEYFKAALVLRTQAEEAQKEIGAKEKEIGAKEKEIGAKEKEIGAKEKEIGAKEKEIGEKLLEKQKEIVAKEKEIGAKEKEIGEKLLEKQKEIGEKLLEKQKEIGAKEKEIGAKEKEIYELKEKTSILTRDLSDANSEKLKLKGKLDVRGMIEEIELSLYPGKVVDPNVSRSTLWKEAKKNPQHKALFTELENCFPSHEAKAKDAAISTIKSIYKKASDLIHSHVSSNQVAIFVRMQDFGGEDELCVIRALAKFYKFRLEEENLKLETVLVAAPHV